MTFKHTNFDDSATMRSLIKVAAEKGWVKQESIQKTASVSEDLSPGDNLTENVIKLCSGLRNSGLDKFADELEIKFLTYKQANSLYGVHKEEGKDLIDAAHPKGGHKMEDLPDAVIGTIIENRLKILNVVNKKPTGKLASHLDIMKAVKVALGQDSSTLVDGKLNEVKNRFHSLLAIMKSNAGESNVGSLSVLAPISKGYTTKPVTESSIKAALNAVSLAKNYLKYLDPKKEEALKKQHQDEYANMSDADRFRYVSAIKDYDTWEKVSVMLDSIAALYNDALKLLGGDVGLVSKFDTLITKLNSYRSLLNDEGFTPEDRTQGNAWISYYISTLENWKTVFAGLDPETKATEAARYDQKFKELKVKVDELYKQLVA